MLLEILRELDYVTPGTTYTTSDIFQYPSTITANIKLGNGNGKFIKNLDIDCKIGQLKKYFRCIYAYDALADLHFVTSGKTIEDSVFVREVEVIFVISKYEEKRESWNDGMTNYVLTVRIPDKTFVVIQFPLGTTIGTIIDSYLENYRDRSKTYGARCSDRELDRNDIFVPGMAKRFSLFIK